MQEQFSTKRLVDGYHKAFVDSSIEADSSYSPQFISNSNGKKVLTVIENELKGCDDLFISVAFITMGGIAPLLGTLKDLEDRGAKGRILTTDYLMFSDPKALDKLNGLSNLDVRVFKTAENNIGFHTKDYMFHNNGDLRIIVGSSNLTQSALSTNHEWNTRNEFGDGRLKQYRVIERAVLRFEEFMKVTKARRKNYSLDVRTVDENDLNDLYDFMSKEHLYYEESPEIYEKFPEKRQSRARGANTLSENFKKLRAFFNWAQAEDIIRVSPFLKFKCEKELYGTPYYLTQEEMQKILNTDLSATPEYERQRDVFIFNCCIGCRVGDLLHLKKSDVIDGAIEYIATKTIADNAMTVRVPLNTTALAIIEKYKDYHETKLLPFISSQKYNDYIKVILTKCGITRFVTVLDPITRREEKHPINEIGSSHMARRTFIANIYNKVPDPNVIGSMTVHVEGRRAFARYRTIEEDLKKSLVDILG